MTTQILMTAFIVVAMAIVLLTPSQVRSTYSVQAEYLGGWLLIQDFKVFGFTWRSAWFVDVERGAWVDVLTRKPVSNKRSEWLTGLVMKWQDAKARSQPIPEGGEK